MLKVFFITRKWPPAVGGMETYSLELSKELASICDLRVRALPGRENGKPPSLLALAFFVLSSALEVIKHKHCDVIHLGDLVLWPLCVARVFRPSVRLIVTAYGLDIVYGTRKGLLPAMYRLYLTLGMILIGKEIKVIAISNATAKLCQMVGFCNICVVNLGVHLPEEQSTIPCDTTPCDTTPYVLFVGRLVKRKGAGWFAKKVLPLIDKDIKMIVVGKRWDESEWSAISNNIRIEYRGVVTNDELKKLRKAALVVLMPNVPTGGEDIEGFGLTALEAAADGGVLLASGIEGIVDAVIDGETGFLLNAEDPCMWANKISEIRGWSNETRNLFLLRAREVIAHRYSWKQVARKSLENYHVHTQNELTN